MSAPSQFEAFASAVALDEQIERGIRETGRPRAEVVRAVAALVGVRAADLDAAMSLARTTRGHA